MWIRALFIRKEVRVVIYKHKTGARKSMLKKKWMTAIFAMARYLKNKN